MPSLKVVLLTDSHSINQNLPLPYKYYGQKLWETIQHILKELHYPCEIVELNKLDFQEDESINKFLNADIVLMDVTNQDRRPTYMYHKGNRESVDCMDDIVLIQASDVENDNAIQDLKTTCKIKHLIVYRYDEEKQIFYDLTPPPVTPLPSFRRKLKSILVEAAKNIQQELATRYLNRLEKRKNEVHDTNAERSYLWKEICDEILSDANQNYATPKLITQLMYAFRDIQDYQSMIELTERCEKYEVISKKIQNNMMISYLAAFARSRRNQGNDRDKALEILERLCQTKKTESKLSNDIICLCGRIYKDKFTESNCQDKNSLEKAIEWYRKGFAADPNIYAGINLLFLLAIKTDDLYKNSEAYNTIMKINALLGKKCRALQDLTDYWDVATYFELQTIQHDWQKACLAALFMYKLNPPIWYLKSTINNLKILHQARLLRAQQPSTREQPQTISPNENVYSFWIDFFSDAIDSSSSSSSEEESALPAQLPILFCDNYEKPDGAIIKNVYVEAYLQLNFYTANEPETLVIRILDQQKELRSNELVKIIEMNSIRSIRDVKSDNRSIFFYAYESSKTFSVAELQIFFSSTERRAAFNRKMSKYRAATTVPEDKLEFDLEFERDQQGQRIALGQGKYGRVYLARDRLTCKSFAVKEIPMRNPSYTEFVENEIKILSMLNHKNIVSYYGTAIDSKKKPHIFQVIMEYVDGGSLFKHLAKIGQFSETAIQIYTRQILEGIQYLHENHIVHRDIKSANILLNSRGEIKIADFGTSKRLAGLHLCTEDTVGTLHNMCPEVILVSPMGYGPEVDIWSVGCTVIEMASGKRPFHNVPNECALLFKLGSEKQPPEIPPELSDVAKDFLAKCFEPKDRRPSAKDLLNHPFCILPRTKTGLPREISGYHNGDRPETAIRLSDSAPCLHRSSSEDVGMVFEPARHLTAQVSIDDCRRHELAKILREHESREDLIAQWISLIEEKSETELLDIEKLFILLTGICNYLDFGNVGTLEETLDKICDRSKMDSDIRIDLERSFYLFIKAANNVLASRNLQAPHVLFALDNIMRRVAEHLVGLIRPDFIPADGTVPPMTPNNELLTNGSYPRTSSTSSFDGANNDELARLHHQYRKLAERNREQLQSLIKIESSNSIELNDLLTHQRNGTSDTTKEFFLSTETSCNGESPSPQNSPISSSVQRTTSTPQTPTTRGIKRSRQLLDLELEHERLLKELIDNRTRLSEILHS